MPARSYCAARKETMRPYTDFIPRNIAWYTATNWPNVTAAPTNADTPHQLWRDNGVLWEMQAAARKWWEPPPSLDLMPAREYTVFVFNADGTPALTPIDSKPFLATYTSLSVINTYREFAFRFPTGVPYTRQVTIPASQAGNLNFGGTRPANQYPVQIPSDTIFFLDNGAIVGQSYEQFIRDNQPPPLSDEQKVTLVLSTGARPDLNFTQKVGMFRQILMERPSPAPLI